MSANKRVKRAIWDAGVEMEKIAAEGTGQLTDAPSSSAQNNASSSNAPASGGLFGSSTSQSTSAGNLFGGAAANQSQSQSQSQPQQQQQSAGLGGFGNTATSQASGGTSLFGSTAGGGGGLFGSTPSSQPQQQSGSMFGNTQNNQASSGGGLGSMFGASQPQQQSQQPSGGSVFGGFGNQNRPSLFGASATNNNANTGGGGLFGASTNNNSNSNNNPGGSSTFGNNTFLGRSLFGANANQPQNQQQPEPQPSIFGLSATHPSMLNASQYRNSQYGSVAGKLTMGQPAGTNQQQPGGSGTVQGAVNIDFNDMRSTTRFADCKEQVRKEIESIDKMIQDQEKFCRDIEAFLPKHGQDVKSLAPDVDLIAEKSEAVEHALGMDAQGVEAQKKVLETDVRDFERCERVITNLSYAQPYRFYGGIPPQHPTTSDEEGHVKDMDLINNYFGPLASNLQQTLESYTANLAEIEGHLRVIEASTIAQAQQLAAKRNGSTQGGKGSGEESVRELADTLRGFERSILGVAGVVGECREGVNEIVLKRGGGLIGRW